MPAKKQRRLIPEKLLKELYELHEVGVPTSKLVKRLEHITHPVLSNLLAVYSEYVNETDKERKETIYFSLFPAWLDIKRIEVQACPPSWRYVGLFPLGTWSMTDEDD